MKISKNISTCLALPYVVLLTPEYWENLFRQLPSSDTQIIDSRENYLLRYAVDGNVAMINQADFIKGKFASQIDEIIEFYTSQGKSFTVTLYDYLNNKRDENTLLRRGFVKQEAYQTLVAPIDTLLSKLNSNQSNFKIKVVGYNDLLDDDHVRILFDAFPSAYESLDQIRTMIIRSNQRAEQDDRLDLINFVAYDKNTPVATGVLYFNKDWETTASLNGAAVLPAYQGMGIYTDLLRSRAMTAAEHGYTHLMIQADVETSAPIVRSKGFTMVNEFTDYHYYIQEKK